MLILAYYWMGIVHALLEVTIFSYGPIAKWLDKRIRVSFKKLGLEYEEDGELDSKNIVCIVLLWPIYVLFILALIIVGKED